MNKIFEVLTSKTDTGAYIGQAIIMSILLIFALVAICFAAKECYKLYVEIKNETKI